MNDFDFGKLVIDKLRRENTGVRVRDFKKQLFKTLLDDEYCSPDHGDIGELSTDPNKFSFIPGAYLIDAENRVAQLFEVEQVAQLAPEELSEMAEAWFILDCWGWDLALSVSDRYGNWKEMSLCEQWYEQLSLQA